MTKNKKIRQPIITVCGHVDHGKTSILDKIRGTSVQQGEAGGITQKISFTSLPAENIKARSGEVLEKFKISLEIPGFLFIDTPGHAAFTNLRKRGGSLADLAVLVIDINEGIKPQTQEVLQILKANKTPFIIALNKIDNISGWKKSESGFVFDSLDKQAINVKQVFDEKLMTLMGALQSYKIEPELYMDIKDFTKKVAIVPCSAETGEGISELIAMLVALSQKFLKHRIEIGNQGKGVVLEVKKEKSINYMECILYDGHLKSSDEIAIASFDELIVSKIRIMEEARELSKGFKPVKESVAASGLRLQITAKEEVLPGMPFQVVNKNLQEIKKEFSEELKQEVEISEKGIVVKADSLGSLEALLVLLKQKQIQVIKAGIGNLTKKDIYLTESLPEEDRVILGFNVDVEEDVEYDKKKIKVISNEVVYKIIEDFEEWKQEKLKEIERAKLKELPSISKVTILPYVFRNTHPAIFGVRVDGGLLKQEVGLIDKDGKKVGRVKAIQEDKDNLKEAESGKEVAISMPGVNFQRQLKEGDVLFSNLSETDFRKFKKNKDLLTKEEKKVLMEIAEVKRKESDVWGV